MHSTTQLYKSWVLVIEANVWVPPISEPKLSQEQIDNGYYYEWDENIYQENSALENPHGWILIKK